MGFDLKFEYISCYYENGQYVSSSPSDMSGIEVDFYLDYLYKMNRMVMRVCDRENYESIVNGNNVHFYCFSNHAVLFKTFGRFEEGFLVNELEGIWISDKKIRTAWLFLQPLIGFLYSDLFYDLQDKKTLTENEMEQIEKEILPLLYHTKDFHTLQKSLSDILFPYSFSLACVVPDADKIQFYKNGGYEIVSKQGQMESLTEVLHYGSMVIEEGETDWILKYEIPSMRHMPPKEKIQKKFHEVRRLKKQNRVYWYALKAGSSKGEHLELPCLEQEKAIPFEKIKEKLRE